MKSFDMMASSWSRHFQNVSIAWCHALLSEFYWHTRLFVYNLRQNHKIFHHFEHKKGTILEGFLESWWYFQSPKSVWLLVETTRFSIFFAPGSKTNLIFYCKKFLSQLWKSAPTHSKFYHNTPKMVSKYSQYINMNLKVDFGS